MKTTSRALAGLGALGLATMLGAAPARAQSSVTVSGLLDIGLIHQSASLGTDRWKVGSIQRSNIAFSGSEDLGGGLQATFRLSHRFNPDEGSLESTSKPFWHGESTVGLKGAFGSVQVGRRLDAVNSQDWQFDPWGNFDRVASPAWDTWHYNYASDPRGNAGSAEYGRLNNGLFYDSPTLEGFSLHLSTSPEKAATDLSRPVGVTLNYSSERAAVMLAHSRNSAEDTDRMVGVRLNFAPLAVMAAWNVSEAGGSTARALTAGLEYGLGATTLKAGWGRVTVEGTQAARVLGVGASHALSKRTSVYLDASRKTFGSTAGNLVGAGLAHSF